MNGELNIPQYLTHYYREHPFRTLTELLPRERARVIEGLSLSGRASRRLQSAFYFEQRLQDETVMYDQFLAKGGTPQRRRPHYAILGESDIWQAITLHCLRIPLTAIPSSQLSFTYTDSWSTYVEAQIWSDEPLKELIPPADRTADLTDGPAGYGRGAERQDDSRSNPNRG